MSNDEFEEKKSHFNKMTTMLEGNHEKQQSKVFNCKTI